jgi:hypothetical protein
LLVVQESVVTSPELMKLGFAESVQVGAGVCMTTVIGAEQFTVPPGPLAVRVYVADCEGLTTVEPLVFTPPTPVSDTDVALFVVQESVEELPC